MDVEGTVEREKDPQAVALGRRGAKKGGLARAARLIPEERRRIAQKAARVRWFVGQDDRTEDYQAAVDALAAVPDADLAARAFSEVWTAQLQEQWSSRCGLRKSQGEQCASRLLGERSDRNGPGMPKCCPPGTDHPSLWLREGKAARFVIHVYPWGLERIEALVSWCKVRGLATRLSAESWYFPTGTMMIEIGSRSEFEIGYETARSNSAGSEGISNPT